MSKVILHEALPAILAESSFLQLVLQVAAKVGKLVRGPSAYKVTRVYLEDDEPNFSWLPEELLNEPDKENVDEETQCDNMDDISPTQSIEESVQLSAPSGGDGDDLGGNNEDACQIEPQHMYSNIFYGDQGSSSYSLATNENDINESSS
ncbi:hypothetical protein GOBAR_AA30204 [Gossypium barbadense]|uniref:Uncharacterized protein n=1 Tax=Gossypium barbadense TaxID=3634 RepID=A0A2P5WHB2_GOSBA|nr:hypothetical protein GOBAR_AA30204 [Gossypium barbadense]